jgi:hypothetical protein
VQLLDVLLARLAGLGFAFKREIGALAPQIVRFGTVSVHQAPKFEAMIPPR